MFRVWSFFGNFFTFLENHPATSEEKSSCGRPCILGFFLHKRKGCMNYSCINAYLLFRRKKRLFWTQKNFQRKAGCRNSSCINGYALMLGDYVLFVKFFKCFMKFLHSQKLFCQFWTQPKITLPQFPRKPSGHFGGKKFMWKTMFTWIFLHKRLRFGFFVENRYGLGKLPLLENFIVFWFFWFFYKLIEAMVSAKKTTPIFSRIIEEDFRKVKCLIF